MLEQLAPPARRRRDAWLVVQRNLGADSLQRWLAETLGDGVEVERATTSKGFRVLTVTHAG